ncbi:MAG: PTS glucose transporter subunit IIA [Enterocloster sp.]
MFGSLKKLFGGAPASKQIMAPVAGKVIPMSEVADPTFSQEILGKGVAIVPSEGKFVAPVSGEVAVLFETKHAVSIRSDNGTELILHIGLDTVKLNGQYYKAHVKQGDRVKAGDLMMEVELDKVKEAGYDVTTPVIICNTPDYPNMVCHTGMEVKAMDPVIDL